MPELRVGRRARRRLPPMGPFPDRRGSRRLVGPRPDPARPELELEGPSPEPRRARCKGLAGCVAFSPDGQWAASGSKDHTVQLGEMDGP